MKIKIGYAGCKENKKEEIENCLLPMWGTFYFGLSSWPLCFLKFYLKVNEREKWNWKYRPYDLTVYFLKRYIKFEI